MTLCTVDYTPPPHTQCMRVPKKKTVPTPQVLLHTAGLESFHCFRRNLQSNSGSSSYVGTCVCPLSSQSLSTPFISAHIGSTIQQGSAEASDAGWRTERTRIARLRPNWMRQVRAILQARLLQKRRTDRLSGRPQSCVSSGGAHCWDVLCLWRRLVWERCTRV